MRALCPWWWSVHDVDLIGEPVWNQTVITSISFSKWIEFICLVQFSSICSHQAPARLPKNPPWSARYNNSDTALHKCDLRFRTVGLSSVCSSMNSSALAKLLSPNISTKGVAKTRHLLSGSRSRTQASVSRSFATSSCREEEL